MSERSRQVEHGPLHVGVLWLAWDCGLVFPSPIGHVLSAHLLSDCSSLGSVVLVIH